MLKLCIVASPADAGLFYFFSIFFFFFSSLFGTPRPGFRIGTVEILDGADLIVPYAANHSGVYGVGQARAGLLFGTFLTDGIPLAFRDGIRDGNPRWESGMEIRDWNPGWEPERMVKRTQQQPASRVHVCCLFVLLFAGPHLDSMLPMLPMIHFLDLPRGHGHHVAGSMHVVVVAPGLVDFFAFSFFFQTPFSFLLFFSCPWRLSHYSTSPVCMCMPRARREFVF